MLVMEEELAQELRKISEKEDVLLEDSIKGCPISIHIFFAGLASFEDLIVEVAQDGGIDGTGDILFQHLKNLKQSLYFGPIYALRGNIRACYMEMRFAIETLASFAYMAEKENLDELKKVCKGLVGNKSSEELLVERKKINEKIKGKAYVYLEKKYPNENKNLQIFKKEIINNYHAHGDAMQLANMEKKIEGGRGMIGLSMFDSDEYREQELERSINISFLILHSMYLIICGAIENRNNCNTDEYRRKIKEIHDRLKEHTKGHDG